MSGTRIEKEVEIYATNPANKTTSSICEVKPEHSRLKPYGNP
jgi:hypothetical protein